MLLIEHKKTFFWINLIQFYSSDTDSFLFKVRTDDFYKDLEQMKDEHFDTSNYDPDSPIYSKKHKSVPGFFKDETGGYPIKSFCGLRSKVRTFSSSQS